MTHQPTTDDNLDPAIVNSSHVSERATLAEVLRPDEIDLMARVLGNRLSQHQIAEQDNAPRSTIEYRIRSAARKLAKAGLAIALPKRGRRPLVRDVPVDPLALGCLRKTGAEDGAGRPRMKWKKAKKIDDDETNHQW